MFTDLVDRVCPTPASSLRHQLPHYLSPSSLPNWQILTDAQLCPAPNSKAESEFLNKVEAAIPEAMLRGAFFARWYRLLAGIGAAPERFEISPPTHGMRPDGIPYIVHPSLCAAALSDRASVRTVKSFRAPDYASIEAIHVHDCGLCQEPAGELERQLDSKESERVLLFRPNFVVLPEPYPRFLGECVIARPGHDPSFWSPKDRPSPSIHTLKALLNLASELGGSIIRGHSLIKMSIPGHAHSHFVPLESTTWPAIEAATTEARSILSIGRPFFTKTLPYEAIALVGGTVTEHATHIFNALTKLDESAIPYTLAHSHGTTLIIPGISGQPMSLRGALLNFSSANVARTYNWEGLLVKGTLENMKI